MSKEENKYEGVWFNSESSTRLPGILIIDNNNLTQTLKIYSKVDFNSNPLSISESNFNDEISLCGDCEFDNKITLSNCVYKGKNHIGDGTFEIIFKPTFCYCGGVSFNIEETNIISLTCTYPFLASWYDTNKLFFGSYYMSNDYMEDLTPAIKPNELFDEIKLNDDFTIIIERRYRKENWKGNVAKIRINHFVHFKSANQKPFKEFQKMAIIFMQLIKLSTGKLIHIDYVSMRVDKKELIDFNGKDETFKSFIDVYITNYSSLSKRRLFERENIHTNNLLFYGGEEQYEKLHLIIRNWYATYDKYKPIYNIFLDTFEWFENTEAYLTQIMFNNRFLNLIQAVENFHYVQNNKYSGEDKDEVKAKAALLLEGFENQKDKDWLLKHIHPDHITLKERLENLVLDKFDYITDALFTNRKSKKNYIVRIICFRNNLSHGDKFELDIDKTSDYYYKTLLILLTCILSNLELSNQEIGKIYDNTIKYKSMITYIKNYRKR